MKFLNKNVFITGGTFGLGLELAKAFLEEGANIGICSRNYLNSLDQLLKQNFPNQKIRSYQCDVSNEGDVKDTVSLFIDEFETIDVLINNAGIHGEIGFIDDIKDFYRWGDAVKTNLFGSAYMMRYFIPYMKDQKKGKIIQISGGGATSAFPSMSSYAVSKAAVVRLAETIAVEVKDWNIDINCVAPGIMNTGLLSQILDNPEKIDAQYYEKIENFSKNNDVNYFEAPVALCKALASDDFDGITGKLISAQWDNWKDIPLNKEKVMNSDMFTLRRIIGKDRGMEEFDV